MEDSGTFLSLDCAGSTDAGYLFIQYFYLTLFEYYIDERGNVLHLLNHASQQIWGVPYSQSPFYPGFTYAGISMQMVVSARLDPSRWLARTAVE